jgi:hypothetical protein
MRIVDPNGPLGLTDEEFEVRDPLLQRLNLLAEEQSHQALDVLRQAHVVLLGLRFGGFLLARSDLGLGVDLVNGLLDLDLWLGLLGPASALSHGSSRDRSG